MQRWLLAGGATILIAGPTLLAFFSGAFFDRPRIVAAMVAWGLVALAALLAPQLVPRATAGRVAVAGLFLLSAWTALSIAWAPLGARAEDDLQRIVLYLGAFIAATALLRGPAVRRWLEPALTLGTLVIVLYGLSERLLPGLVELDRSRTAAGRLEQPLSYWNAFGLVAALGLVLVIRVAGDPERTRAVRGAAAAAGVPIGLGLYLSFGRGALAAAGVGMLVLLALAPAGRLQLRSAVIVIAAAALAAFLANRYSTVRSLDPGEQGDPGEGLKVLAGLVVLSAVAAAVVLREPRRVLALPRWHVSRPKAVLAATGVFLIAAALAVAVFEGAPEGSSPARGANPARLGSVDSNRYRYWGVAADAWLDRPIVGSGTGGFQVAWRKERDRVDRAGDAHSLYVETAAELGTVGVVLLLLFLGGVAVSVARLYQVEPALATGPAAGLAVWACHAGLDWDWEMPAVTLLAVLLASAPIAWREEAQKSKSGQFGKNC
jgi:hypothetical protein